ncbi:hypothetical protein CFP56_031211, partial [Quercus suber]
DSSIVFPLDLFQHLTCLRSLNLEYSAFEKNFQMNNCRKIKKLPQGMVKLIKLRHLLIDGCHALTEPFPKGLGD